MGRVDWRANDGKGWEDVPRRMYVGGGDCVDLKPGEHIMRVHEDGGEILYVGSPSKLRALKERLEGDGGQ